METFESLIGLHPGELLKMLIGAGLKLLVTAVIFFVGFKLANIVSHKVLPGILRKREADESLVGFVSSLFSVVIKILTLITALAHMGVEMTSFVALLGAAGIAIGMAFSGTLSNFAGGVMILLFKPFKIGDYISAQGEEGIVKKILIFNTILHTRDNKVIYVANGSVANNTIVNYTEANLRRVDWTFGIAYGDDLKKAKAVLYKFAEDDKRIIDTPKTYVGLNELGDSSVNLKMMSWVKTDDYWDVFFEMNERVYEEFGENGLNIPFPQMDVHIQK